MKKIFAIALALVMVLSMASAFAINNCSAPSFGWPCDTEIDLCGKGAVEVVPYVKINSACDSWAWEANTCAGAVNTEKVYYAIKMTVEANADPAWWGAAYLTVEVDGLSGATTLTKAGPLYGSTKIDWAEDEDDVEYYLAKDLKSWIAVEDWEDLSAKA
ncbi:MAG: hypothetical protein IJB30_08795, partial [Clostridia bacterium]|nr:hypothetical protein [Clostridia bacterium]